MNSRKAKPVLSLVCTCGHRIALKFVKRSDEPDADDLSVQYSVTCPKCAEVFTGNNWFLNAELDAATKLGRMRVPLPTDNALYKEWTVASFEPEHRSLPPDPNRAKHYEMLKHLHIQLLPSDPNEAVTVLRGLGFTDEDLADDLKHCD